MTAACYVNHEFIILDASASMRKHSQPVVKVTDTLISNLAAGVKEYPDQETRITIYTFALGLPGHLQCLVWDKDVLRVPSIAGLYHADGGTPLCEAMTKVIEDMKEIPVKYGDHTVLGYMVTDGGEGGEHSDPRYRTSLPSLMRSVPDTWTLAALVPGVLAKRNLVNYGFAAGNIEIWDPSSREGVEEVGRRIQDTTASYYGARRAGVKSTGNLFTMAAPSASSVAGSLTPMTPGSYYFEEVTADDLAQIDNGRIDQFMAMKLGRPYLPGDPVVFYQMFKRERIQGYKRIAVAIPDHHTRQVQVFTGANARVKLGLPEDKHSEVRVSPGRWKDYKVFIETRSMNRKLYPGTSVLILR